MQTETSEPRKVKLNGQGISVYKARKGAHVGKFIAAVRVDIGGAKRYREIGVHDTYDLALRQARRAKRKVEKGQALKTGRGLRGAIKKRLDVGATTDDTLVLLRELNGTMRELISTLKAI